MICVLFTSLGSFWETLKKYGATFSNDIFILMMMCERLHRAMIELSKKLPSLVNVSKDSYWRRKINESNEEETKIGNVYFVLVLLIIISGSE